MNNDNKYFAAKEPKKTAQILLNRANSWFNNLENNGYLEKVKQCWAAYHGAYYSGIENAHRISFGGEQGELAQIAVNHLRNIARNMLVMITATRPSLQARATNIDYKSVVQTKLANGLLDYYLREKRLETYLKTACEYAIVLGSGYIKMEWNATSGNIYDYSEAEFDPETGEPTKEAIPIYEGDVSFENLSPFDVVFDDNVETVSDNIWVLCRTFKNKYDIIAKYPEYKDKIEALPTKTDLNTINISQTAFGETELIPIYEFYHKRTESIPEGRYLMFLDDNVVLVDTAMPYRNLPIYRMSASDILGTPYGYSPLFDLLPVQEAVNSLYSSILTNQSTFAVQNIFVKRGSDVSFESISGGLNIIEANEKPEPLQLTSTPPEVFNFLQMLVKDMEVISGVNSVARGNPESSLKSGTALALVQSMALQFMSGLQQSYVQLIEDVGTGMINMLRDFASVPRVAMIAGKNNRSYMKEFNGDDLSNVNRVIVDIGNPLSKTTAGKVQMAEQMLQMGLIKRPDEYFMVMETGKLDDMTDDIVREELSIKAENEKLVDNEPVIAVYTDNHLSHILEHKNILSDPELRFDKELVERVYNHINEHVNLLRTVDPALLTLMGQQPLGPAAGSPPAPQQGQNVPDASMQGAIPEQMQQTTANTVDAQQTSGVAGMPSIPKVEGSLLPNPELQAQTTGNVE